MWNYWCICACSGLRQRIWERLLTVASRHSVTARARAREARAKLTAQRKDHEQLVDSLVTCLLEATDEVQTAENSLAAAQVNLAASQDVRLQSLIAVVEAEPDLEVVLALTGATKAEVSEARKEARRRTKAEKNTAAASPGQPQRVKSGGEKEADASAA